MSSTTVLTQRGLNKGKYYPGTAKMHMIVQRQENKMIVLQQENIFAKRRAKTRRPRQEPRRLVTLLGLFLLILTTLIVSTDLVLSFVKDISKANEDVMAYDVNFVMNSSQQDQQKDNSGKMTIGRTTGKHKDGRRKRSGSRDRHRDNESRHDDRRHHDSLQELKEEDHHPRPKQDLLNEVGDAKPSSNKEASSSRGGQLEGSKKSDSSSSVNQAKITENGEEPKQQKDDTELQQPNTKDNNSNDHETKKEQEDDAAAKPPPQQQQQQVQEDLMPIHLAASAGNLEVVKKHVERSGKETVHLKDPNGWTPLHEAARRGHMPVIQYLVENGADKNVLTGMGESPLWLVKHSGSDHHPLVKYMEEDLGALEVGPDL